MTLFAFDDAQCLAYAEEVPTPLFLYSAAQARRGFLALRDALPPRVRLVYAVKAIDKVKGANEDQKVGVNIVRKALEAPARQIAANAGADASVIVGKLRESKSETWGYNAQNGEFVDLVKEGIIDPTKVVRTALQDAASVASLLITTEAMVAEKPEPKGAGGMPGGGMGDMGGMGGMGGMDF